MPPLQSLLLVGLETNMLFNDSNCDLVCVCLGELKGGGGGGEVFK